MPPYLKRSIKIVYIKKGMYDQLVAHLEEESELSGVENDGEQTVTVALTRNSENKPDFSKTPCFYCKKLGHLFKDCRKRIRKEQEQKQNPTQKNLHI